MIRAGFLSRTEREELIELARTGSVLLHILPLNIIPLETKSLRDARLTKNSHLESVVELFSNQSAGSGQIYPQQLSEFFDFSGDRKNDHEIIMALGELPSFDIYSLRIKLRELGIDVDQCQHLRLSREMQSGLAGYMRHFTKPLVAEIYGDGIGKSEDYSDLLKLFADPKNATARKNLLALASKLELDLLDIPRFLARYADVYLSLAYYSYCLDLIHPTLHQFLDTLKSLQQNPQYNSNRKFVDACSLIAQRLTEAEFSISRMLEIFQVRTEDMWKSISGTGFQAMEKLILQYQKEISGSICALTIKMNSWEQLKGKSRLPNQVSFIMSDMLKGIERVSQVTPADTIH